MEVPHSLRCVAPCDIAEDVAIAYGYNNIKRTVPPVNTVGAQQPVNHFSDMVRQEMAMQGFTEVLAWILCSHDDNFANVLREDDGNSAAIVANPSGLDVQVARSSLLQGVLKAMGANKDAPLPAKLFEVGDVVLIDPEAGDGSEKRSAAARALLQPEGGVRGGSRRAGPRDDHHRRGEGWRRGVRGGGGVGTDVFPGRQAHVARRKKIGTFGIVHPDVLAKFDIVNPCSVLELDLEPLMDIDM